MLAAANRPLPTGLHYHHRWWSALAPDEGTALLLAKGPTLRRGLAEARVLAGHPALASLQELTFHARAIGDEGARVLAQAQNLGELRRLDLSFNQLGDRGAAALASAPWLGKLTGLRLADNPLGPEAVAALVGATGPLAELHLERVAVGDDAVAALCASRAADGLQVLNLQQTRVGDRAAEALAWCPRLTELEQLNWGGASSSPTGPPLPSPARPTWAG